MGESFNLGVLAIFCTFILFIALVGVAGRIKDLAEAYQRRTDLQAEQAATRTRAAIEKKQEKAEESERRYWQTLWERLQQLQLEYLALEKRFSTASLEERKHAQRLAARIALLWIRFLNVYDECTENLEGFPTRARETENQVVQHYVERYSLTAGVTLPTRFTPKDVQWWEGLEELLNQRLCDLNTPVTSPVAEADES